MNQYTKQCSKAQTRSQEVAHNTRGINKMVAVGNIHKAIPILRLINIALCIDVDS